MRTSKHFYSIILATSFCVISACKKDELPVTAPDKGAIITNSVSMTSNYSYQVYFDLSSNTSKGSNLKVNWDLGISCTTENAIILNTSKMMFASKISNETFEELTDTLGFSANKKTDASTGKLDELALSEGSLFVIDKGLNEQGIHLGFFKIEIIENTSSSFTGRFANLDGTNEETVVLQKDLEYNYIFVNWLNGLSEVSVEPPKTTWDLVFTQYTYLFYEPELTYYLVTGCLTNSCNTKAISTNIAFESIDLIFAQSQVFNANRDNIGYDWKTFDGTSYSINSNKSYIIQNQDGYFYKLRFIDFYDEQGVKGTPTFEFQQL